MDTVKRNLLNLMDTVRSFNSTATIAICGLLPRLGDWACSKEFSLDMNNFLQVWCSQQEAKGRRVIFFPNCKFVSEAWGTFFHWLQVGQATTLLALMVESGRVRQECVGEKLEVRRCWANLCEHPAVKLALVKFLSFFFSWRGGKAQVKFIAFIV